MKHMTDLLTGTVFDIQRCSMHDGPGIRTSVFFKGCPLSCKWCHNPESQSIKQQLAFYSDKCTFCGKCATLCPEVHQLHGMQHTLDLAACTFCGSCEKRCPSHALKVIGKTVSVEEIMDVVRKDRNYYKQTGGGLTVTGGEPFSQFEFLKELLKAAKKEQIHTCVETCGYVRWDRLEELLPFVDLFLFDYKVTSPELHKQNTGVDNFLILENLERLYEHQKKTVLRCPVIPGYNDTMEHFKGIAWMERKYPCLEGIEIMPYHNLGKAKAFAIGKDYEVTAATADSDQKTVWKRKLAEAGCSHKVVDSFT